MPYQRDPVSELFDNGARRLLERLYEAPRGTAVSTIVGDGVTRPVPWPALIPQLLGDR